MDRNLVEQKLEMSKVYEELFKTISTKYFNFEEVCQVMACGLAVVDDFVDDILISWIYE